MKKVRILLTLGLNLGLLGSCAPWDMFTPVINPLPQPAFVTETPSAPAGDTGATEVPQDIIISPVFNIPEGPLTIVPLGDSLTEGQGDDLELGYPGRLKSMVEQLRPGSTILNFGRSGWAAPDLVNGLNGEPSQLQQALDAKPTIVLVWIGSNDLWNLYEYGPEPMTAEAEQADLDAFKANIDTILRSLSNQGVVVLVALLDDQSKRPVAANPPNPAEPAFASITSADLALMSVHMVKYNEILKHKAYDYNAGLVDFYNTTLFTDAATLYDDGNHPNQVGYKIITQIWYDAVAAVLG